MECNWEFNTNQVAYCVVISVQSIITHVVENFFLKYFGISLLISSLESQIGKDPRRMYSKLVQDIISRDTDASDIWKGSTKSF